jgi:hypothetical protein
MTIDAGLTGNQVRRFRDHLEEGQAVFGNRFAMSQPRLRRLELKGDQFVDTPETRLIRRVAVDLGFAIDEAAQ